MIFRRDCVFGQSQPRTKAVCLAWPWDWDLGCVDAWNRAQYDLAPKLGPTNLISIFNSIRFPIWSLIWFPTWSVIWFPTWPCKCKTRLDLSWVVTLLTDLKCGWEMGGANFSSSSNPSQKCAFMKIYKLWQLSQQGFCVLTNLRVKHLLHLYLSSANQTDTQWRKVNQQFLTKMPKKDEADKQFESNWERDLYEEMGQGGKFCFKTLHRGNKSRLHRLQQTLLMTSDQEMAFSKGAHYMSKCHLICQTIYMKPTHRNISWGRKFCRRQ